ncbi:helix-turn-helix domain-containing protein [Paraburkholderia terrae]|uniref:helix-turn-helix domain-containing protein n=1 Tax=Paraburkholderia terrae TaxID=311230 RepID=UPI00296B5135|nr:helix-turn-helix transcriptional regulator [Paraburkholderia terrae]MDW3660436.1 helix-turn-helix transcriptional regulator [Paraburkholderia terrae]
MIDDQLLYKTIGASVRALRDKSRMTQAELAIRVGLERTSITNIEKGTQKVPLHVLYRICEAFRVSPLEILPSVEQVQPPTVPRPAFESVIFGGQMVQTTPMVKEVLTALLETRDGNG